MKIGYIMQEGGPDVRQKPLTGPANHVLKVYKEFQALGHEMLFLARYSGVIWKSMDLEHFEPVTVNRWEQGLFRTFEKIVRGIQSRARIPYFNFFESMRFAEACALELSGCDLLYERMGWMGFAGGIAARRLNIPLILEANNGDFITELERLGVAPSGFQRWIAIRLMRSAAHRADHVVATGEGHRQRFISWYQIAPSRVTTVENGSDIVNILERDQLKVFRDSTSSPLRITLVFVGAFEPWHGIMILLPAMKTVVKKIPDARLILIGSGTQKEQIIQQIDDLGLGANVELTGQLAIDQVAHFLAHSDIGVAPYCGWMEYSGLKLFDYKSAGLATIASGENEKPATLEHGVTGWIVPPCNSEALAAAILHLALDDNLRKNLGMAARIEAEQHHSWRHTALRIEELFNLEFSRKQAR